MTQRRQINLSIILWQNTVHSCQQKTKYIFSIGILFGKIIVIIIVLSELYLAMDQLHRRDLSYLYIIVHCFPPLAHIDTTPTIDRQEKNLTIEWMFDFSEKKKNGKKNIWQNRFSNFYFCFGWNSVCVCVHCAPRTTFGSCATCVFITYSVGRYYYIVELKCRKFLFECLDALDKNIKMCTNDDGDSKNMIRDCRHRPLHSDTRWILEFIDGKQPTKFLYCNGILHTSHATRLFHCLLDTTV